MSPCGGWLGPAEAGRRYRARAPSSTGGLCGLFDRGVLPTGRPKPGPSWYKMVRWRDLQKLEGDVADVLHAKGSAVAAEHFREVVAQQLERHADVPLPF